MKARRGATVAEMMVACGLLMLAVGLFLPIWQIAMRTWQRSEEVQSVQRDTLALAYRLRSDYLASRPESLVVLAQPGTQTLLSFLSYEGVQSHETLWTTTGEVMWRKWVQYQFRDGERRVRRRETALATPAQEVTEAPPAWSDSGAHTLAWNVEAFQVNSPTRSLVLRLNLTARQGVSSSSTEIAVMPRLYGMDAAGY